ncbi:DUF4445 domain-containing protein [candidate division WOR-3 bacterium]|nr:DUF4445 domain-containing protein [candidate division WOR-3 bacterium]
MLDTFLNPQRRFGHDVITRISASSDSTIFCQLVQQIRERIFSSISQALRQISLPYNKIESLVFSGNTTMLHLLFELEVSSMGIYPYHTKRLNFNDFKPADIGADMFPHSQIYALPTVSSFLGGDLTGGLTLCYEMGLRSHTFFIDLGTNGELSLINSAGEIFATSCAMGPALEGMNISCGMTADVGAITHVWTDKGSLRYEMIGDSTPVGITGTALIDILSILLEENILTDEGAFANDIDSMLLPSPAKYLLKGNVKQINLWGDISLTQKDVRNVQLAKGASLTASRILLKEAGCSSEEIEQVIIAGAFGKHLNMDNFKRLKFIPGFSAASYHFLGNTSLKAAERACFEQNFLKKASLIRDRVHEIELSMRPTFNKEFIDALNF